MADKAKRLAVGPEETRHMVWCEDGGLPTRAHREWGVAVAEAKRLSRKHPGKRFHVLQSKRIYQKDPAEPASVDAQKDAREIDNG